MNAYARTVGKGTGKVDASIYDMEKAFETETLAGGYFNEPLHRPLSEALLERYPMLNQMPPSRARRWLWEHYASLPSAGRAEFVKQALGVESITAADVECLQVIFGHTDCP